MGKTCRNDNDDIVADHKARRRPEAPGQGAHTPGPWRVSRTVGDYHSTDTTYILAEDEEHPTLIAEIPDHRIGSADRSPVYLGQNAANVALIASAPALAADLEAERLNGAAVRAMLDRSAARVEELERVLSELIEAVSEEHDDPGAQGHDAPGCTVCEARQTLAKGER